jgi:hypothetical protein
LIEYFGPGVARDEALFTHGARVRLRGLVTEADDFRQDSARLRTLPAGGAGVLLRPEAIERISEAYRAHGADHAATIFIEAFGESYGFTPHVVECHAVALWADGDPEPPA